jgi:ribulose-phosphate 3-epimerase
MTMRLLASLASADLLELGREIERLGDWPDFHFDIEDGNFTPNLTFGQKMLRAVSAKIAPRRLDVHMMVNHPLAFLPVLAEANVASVSAHLEALRFPLEFLNGARSLGMQAGLALNIGTPWEAVLPYAHAMDFLLVMTAEPDGLGEKLNETAVEKAMAAAARMPVYVDGALDHQTVARLAEAGIAGCVLGRLVFRTPDPLAAITELRACLP